MIITVCANPAFDKTATVPQLVLGDMNRLENIRYDAGGKGINVALALRQLGAEATCIGCLGTENSSEFLKLTDENNLPFKYLAISGKTRTNLKIFNELDSRVSEFNEPGLEMSAAQFDQLLQLLKQEMASCSYLALCGSLPKGLGADAYQRIIEAFPTHRCVLDADGELLRLGIQAKPFLIKPNVSELERLMQTEIRTLSAIQEAAINLTKQGVKNVIVSMGKDGALYTDGIQTFFAAALKIVPKSSVGAGDSMLAGVLLGLDQALSWQEAFQYGVAAGAASASMEGTQPVRHADVMKLAAQVVLEQL